MTPTVDVPLDEAIEELTGWEIIGIGKRFKCHVTELDPMLMIAAAVWAFENRDGHTRSWDSVLQMPQRELHEYFSDPVGDPDSDAGKDATGDTTTTAT